MITKLFFHQVGDNKKRLIWYWKLLIIIAVLAIVIYSWIDNFSSFNQFGLNVFINNITSLFTPNLNHEYTLVRFLAQTAFFVTGGSFLGFIFAILFSYWTAFKIQPFYIALPIRLITIVLRAFPVLLFGFLFSNLFNKQLAATLTISWFSFLWNTKYITTFFENSNLKYFFNKKIREGSGFKAFWTTIFLSENERLWLFFLYSLEANFRWTTLLSIFGIGGIGQLIVDPLSIRVQFDLVLIPLVVLITFLIFIEVVVFLLSSFVFEKNSEDLRPILKTTVIEKRKWKRIIFILFIVVLISLSLANLVTIDYRINDAEFLQDFFNQFFQLKSNLFSSNDPNINPILMLVKLTTQAISLISLVVIFSILFGFISCNLFKKRFSISFKILLLFVRVVPSILLFRLLDPLFLEAKTTIILVLLINHGSSYGQLMSINFNKANQNIINNYKNHGMTKGFILWNYLLVENKPNLINITSDAYDSVIRDLILFGSFGGSIIGSRITNFFERTQFDNLGSVTIPLMVYLIAIEIIFLSVRLTRISVFKNYLY